MHLHSDIAILELLKIYFYGTNNDTINIENLKSSFEILLFIVNEENKIHINYDFDHELEDFLEKYADYIKREQDNLFLTGEITDLDIAVTDSHEKFTLLDYDIQDIVFDSRIYNALRIPQPISETKDYFDLNREIIQMYLALGKNESQNYFDSAIITRLKRVINDLNELLNNADYATITKLKILTRYYGECALTGDDEPYCNATWYIILFLSNPNKLYTLSYERIEFIVERIDPETPEEDEGLLDSFFQKLNDETEEVYERNKELSENELDEIPYFITIFLISLIEYLKINPDTIAKEGLLIKKYLLLGCPELSHLEKYFLEHNSLDDYPIPPFIDQDEETFECLKETVISCIENLFPENSKLNKPHILSKVITCALFIKTFLSTSINENSKKEIINLIANSPYYKKPSYIEASKIIDTIIFEWNPNLSR